jgi:hypothetical protein
MRLAYPILLLVLLTLIASTWMSSNVLSDPEIEAAAFLNDLRQGDIVKTVRQFGSNACRCPAKGGWVSYLIYKSGQEQNLAFMLGHPFEAGKPKDSPIQNGKEALIPWQKPEDFAVDVPISFKKDQYMPYFLPLKMAYGKDMTEEEFNHFVENPDEDSWKGFTLRLRPGIGQKSIEAPVVDVPKELALQFVSLTGVTEQAKLEADAIKKSQAESAATNQSTADDTTQDESSAGLDSDDIKKALGENATEYLIPQEAGHVLKAQHQTIADDQILKRLPKLQSALLRLHVVRRGKLQRWTIYHFGFMYPKLLLSDGKILPLIHDKKPH